MTILFCMGLGFLSYMIGYTIGYFIWPSSRLIPMLCGFVLTAGAAVGAGFI